MKVNSEVAREKLVNWIVMEQKSFTSMCHFQAQKYLIYVAVEEPYFIDFVKTISPTFKLFGADTVRADIMKQFDTASVLVKEFFENYNGRLSFTMDGWSSITLTAYLALTVHFIDSDWNLCAFVLDFIPHIGDHSGSNLATSVYASLKKYSVHDKVLTFTMDNASSNNTFITALQEKMLEDGYNWTGGLFQVRCFAHVLNLAVQVATSHPTVQPIIKRVEELAVFIRASGQRLEKLEKICKEYQDGPISYKKPTLPVPMHWNSVLTMLVNVLHIAKVTVLLSLST